MHVVVRIAVVVLACLASGCRTASIAPQPEPTVRRGPTAVRPNPLNRFPLSTDILMGQTALGEEVGRVGGTSYNVVYDEQTQSYLDAVHTLVVAQMPEFGKGFAYKLRVTRSPLQPTASCAGGGYSLISLEIIDKCPDVETVAGIIAHEVAHNALRHLTSYYAVISIFSQQEEALRKTISEHDLPGTDMFESRQMALALLRQRSYAVALENSQRHEVEADILGLQLAVAAGFDGRMVADGLYLVLKSIPEGDQRPELRIHKSPLERWTRQMAELALLKKTDRNAFSLDIRRFSAFKARAHGIMREVIEPAPAPTPVPPIAQK